jgi:hypothetical protein
MSVDPWDRYDQLRAVPWSELGAHEQLFVAFGELRTEVNNGGFHQYFFNSDGDHAGQALAAAIASGHGLLSELVGRVIASLGSNALQLTWFERQDALLSMAGIDEALDLFDAEFFELEAHGDLNAAMGRLAYDS